MAPDGDGVVGGWPSAILTITVHCARAGSRHIRLLGSTASGMNAATIDKEITAHSLESPAGVHGRGPVKSSLTVAAALCCLGLLAACGGGGGSGGGAGSSATGPSQAAPPTAVIKADSGASAGGSG